MQKSCMKKTLHKNILRKYDIRGIVGEDLHFEDTYFIGLGLGAIFSRNNIAKVAVGMDGRLSSDGLREKLIAGILESGIDVVKIGVVPTPCLYFSVFHLNLGGGVMITGSHNPKNYNGFKIMLADRAFFGDDVLEIGKICASGDFVLPDSPGKLTEISVLDDYIAKITECVDPAWKINVCFDSGNGCGGEVVEKIAKKFNIPADNLLYCDIDGNFPNHHPDPTIESNMLDLSRLVLQKKSLCGIGFDGDADRIGIVDDKGRFVYGDILVCILAKYLLLEVPGAKIIADIKASKVLFDEITRLGGQAIMWQTGHSLIKNKMKLENAMLAGEMSGHIFYKHRYYGYDDGIYTAMRLIEILYKHNISLSNLIDELPQTFSTPEIKITVLESEKFEIMDNIVRISKEKFENYVDIDGIRVNSENGWWLVRASNTQNCLVVRVESTSAAVLAELKAEVVQVLKMAGISYEF